MRALAALICTLAVVGCRHDNPPTTRDIVWDSPTTEALARRACYDCHSNETHWPWTSWMPIVGSIVTGDVHRGRCHMNFNEWDGPNEEAWDAPDEIRDGEMPLGAYKAMHKSARLTDEEFAQLAAGFERTLAADPPLPGEACEDDEDRERGDDHGGDRRDDDRRRRASTERAIRIWVTAVAGQGQTRR